MNSNIKLVFSDIDGTLLNSNHQIDSETKNAVKLLELKQIPFVLASARSPKGMEQISRDLELKSPLVSYNGALISKLTKDNIFETIDSTPINHSDLKVVMTMIHSDFPDISINLYSNSDWLVEKVDPWVEQEADISKTTPIIEDIFDLINSEKIIAHKLLCMGESQQIKALETVIKKSDLTDVDCYLSKETYLEITASSVSKLTALLKIMDLMNINKNEVMAIGDNYNDIPMIKYAKYGIAMDNAPEEVKQNSSYLTNSNDDNGVAKALNRFIKINH